MADKKISELQYIKGVGPRRAQALADTGIFSQRDLIFYFPFSYIDRNSVSSIAALTASQENIFSEQSKSTDIKLSTEVTVVARIESISERQIGRRRKMLKLSLADGSGYYASIVYWNRTDYFKKIYKKDQILVVSGKPEFDKYGQLIFNHPDIERIDPEDAQLYSSGEILPKYRTTDAMKSAGLNMKRMRDIVRIILDNMTGSFRETLPDYIINKYNFPEINLAVKNMHFPENTEILSRSRNRFKFEEIFHFETYLALRHTNYKLKEKATVIAAKSASARKIYDSLPFELTGDQKKVLREIADDFGSGSPMNRLLQGDVGSGKTIVSVLAMLMAIDSGCQVAMMAPTEILAEQHYQTLSKFLKNLNINIVQLVGGQKAKARREITEQIETGYAHIIIGTHALFQSNTPYNNLGLVIIDEQHRFGVEQRAELKKLGKESTAGDLTPHILVMSATPIPRTLSMTLYGDLDVSLIKQMPKDRKPVKTYVSFESKLPDIYKFIKKEIHSGRQAFIVYPLVEESDKMDLKAATVRYEFLRKEVFPEFRCGLLHGQMFWYEKDEVMQDFLSKKYQILVATTVIEVGIDIPNASVMMIENAERFGLSQLHQLRGRVGRGADQSYCILVTKDRFMYDMKKNDENERKASVIRLKTMAETSDGFKIAERDLQLRGPGDVMGTKQSGLPEFKYLDLVNDGDLITIAKKEAYTLIKNDPHLRAPENKNFRKEFLDRFDSGKNYFDIA